MNKMYTCKFLAKPQQLINNIFTFSKSCKSKYKIKKCITLFSNNVYYRLSSYFLRTLSNFIKKHETHKISK